MEERLVPSETLVAVIAAVVVEVLRVEVDRVVDNVLLWVVEDERDVVVTEVTAASNPETVV